MDGINNPIPGLNTANTSSSIHVSDNSLVEEQQGVSVEELEKIDTNKDGVISEAEFKQANQGEYNASLFNLINMCYRSQTSTLSVAEKQMNEMSAEFRNNVLNLSGNELQLSFDKLKVKLAQSNLTSEQKETVLNNAILSIYDSIGKANDEYSSKFPNNNTEEENKKIRLNHEIDVNQRLDIEFELSKELFSIKCSLSDEDKSRFFDVLDKLTKGINDLSEADSYNDRINALLNQFYPNKGKEYIEAINLQYEANLKMHNNTILDFNKEINNQGNSDIQNQLINNRNAIDKNLQKNSYNYHLKLFKERYNVPDEAISKLANLYEQLDAATDDVTYNQISAEINSIEGQYSNFGNNPNTTTASTSNSTTTANSSNSNTANTTTSTNTTTNATTQATTYAATSSNGTFNLNNYNDLLTQLYNAPDKAQRDSINAQIDNLLNDSSLNDLEKFEIAQNRYWTMQSSQAIELRKLYEQFKASYDDNERKELKKQIDILESGSHENEISKYETQVNTLKAAAEKYKKENPKTTSKLSGSSSSSTTSTTASSTASTTTTQAASYTATSSTGTFNINTYNDLLTQLHNASNKTERDSINAQIDKLLSDSSLNALEKYEIAQDRYLKMQSSQAIELRKLYEKFKASYDNNERQQIQKQIDELESGSHKNEISKYEAEASSLKTAAEKFKKENPKVTSRISDADSSSASSNETKNTTQSQKITYTDAIEANEEHSEAYNKIEAQMTDLFDQLLSAKNLAERNEINTKISSLMNSTEGLTPTEKREFARERYFRTQRAQFAEQREYNNNYIRSYDESERSNIEAERAKLEEQYESELAPYINEIEQLTQSALDYKNGIDSKNKSADEIVNTFKTNILAAKTPENRASYINTLFNNFNSYNFSSKQKTNVLNKAEDALEEAEIESYKEYQAKIDITPTEDSAPIEEAYANTVIKEIIQHLGFEVSKANALGKPDETKTKLYNVLKDSSILGKLSDENKYKIASNYINNYIANTDDEKKQKTLDNLEELLYNSVTRTDT